MSRKVDTFSTIIQQPQVLSNYAVWIPTAPQSLVVCSECNLPQENYTDDQININGQPVYIPTRSQVDGNWSCTLDEGIIPLSAASISVLRGLASPVAQNQTIDNVTLPDLVNQHVRMQFYHTSGLNSLSGNIRIIRDGFRALFDRKTTFIPIMDIIVMLLGTSNLQSTSSFLSANLQGVPTQVRVLKAAWLKQVDAVTMAANKPTDPLRYRLTFRYSALSNSITAVL